MKNRTHGYLFGVAVSAAIILATSSPSDVDAMPGKNEGKGKGQDKVTICHKGHTITIAEPALAAHLAHGDTLGSCDVTPAKNRF